MSPNPVLTIPEEAKEAVLKPKGLPQWAQIKIREQFLLYFFGPSMKATTRSRLLMWTSRKAISAHGFWDRYQEAQNARTR